MSKNVLSTDEVVESIETIRSVLDRTTRYTHISWLGVALTGITGGAAGLLGWLLDASPAVRPGDFLVLWGAAFVTALFCGLSTTARKARLAREPVFSRKLQIVLGGVLPAAVVGALLTVLLWNVGRLDLAPGIWMSLYGVGILAVRHVLDWEFQVTAWSFLVSSAVALFLLRGAPHLSMMISFGGIHVVLGTFRLFKEHPWQPR